MKFTPLKLKCVERLTADAVRLTLDTEGHEETFAFESGQYITFCFDLKDEELHRAYSICSAPHEGKFQVAVKEVPGGRASTHANRSLQTGDVMQVMAPQGNFTLKPDASLARHVILFGAGSGITPLLSIAKTVLKEEPNSRVTLFYGNRSKESIMFYDELDSLAKDDRLDIYHILSDGSIDVPLFNGRITFGKTLELIYSFIKDDMSKEYFICGPSGMMTSVNNALIDNGVAKEHIHLEFFENPGQEILAALSTPAEEPAEDEGEAFSGKAAVTIVVDDEAFETQLDTDGGSILDAALNVGADAPYSCQGGVCTTCRAKLVEGKVRMDSNFALTDQEIEEGYILTCQAHPTTQQVKVSFDE